MGSHGSKLPLNLEKTTDFRQFFGDFMPSNWFLLNNSKTKRLATLEPRFAPHNVMFAVILRWLLSF